MKRKKHWEQLKPKSTKAEQEETTDNKTDKWESKECDNKDRDPKISCTSLKDIYLKAIISNVICAKWKWRKETNYTDIKELTHPVNQIKL